MKLYFSWEGKLGSGGKWRQTEVWERHSTLLFADVTRSCKEEDKSIEKSSA